MRIGLHASHGHPAIVAPLEDMFPGRCGAALLPALREAVA